MNRRRKPSKPKNEWVERCETEQVLKKSSTNYTWDVSPGASDPYASNTMHETHNVLNGMHEIQSMECMH